MEAFRHQRSPGSERFLGVFSPQPASNGTAGDELDEDDVFWTGADEPKPIHSPKPMASMESPNPNPSPALSKSGFRRLPDRSFGILAALPEDDKKRSPRNAAPFLQRMPSFSSASASPSPTSARMIPAIPKPKAEYSMSVPAASGKVYNRSAPVNVPVGPARLRKEWGEMGIEEGGGAGDEDGDEDEMILPPHEIVARASAKESPMTTFSVLERAGRTLKGRDLRRVRNAVWWQTGFID